MAALSILCISVSVLPNRLGAALVAVLFFIGMRGTAHSLQEVFHRTNNSKDQGRISGSRGQGDS